VYGDIKPNAQKQAADKDVDFRITFDQKIWISNNG
jgi:hypothetical protein